MIFHGLVDRVGKAWASPEAWLSGRTLRMLAPVCIGDTLRTEGGWSGPSTWTAAGW